jgi:uncharacterized metal-binding protein YceD (DUF177 family)
MTEDKTNIEIDPETGEVDDIETTSEEDTEIENLPVTSTLPTLRLVKKNIDSTLEITACARTTLQCARLFDHACFRIKTEFNGKESEPKKKPQSYMG